VITVGQNLTIRGTCAGTQNDGKSFSWRTPLL
jgi:hypothetical protein